MNTTSVIKLVGALAWAGVAISSASTATASAITTQVGTYAACANQSSADSRGHCGYAEAGEVFYQYWTNYRQQVKFVSQGCSSGGCAQDTGDVYVDAVYPAGRKVVTSSEPLCNLKYAYGLGSCGC